MLENTEDRWGADFITRKFDDYETDQRKKVAIIATLQRDLESVNMKVENLEKKMNRQEQ